MKNLKLVTLFSLLFVFQSCQNDDVPPKIIEELTYVSSIIDPMDNDNIMEMLSNTVYGQTTKNGRVMSSSIGNVNLDEVHKVDHLEDGVIRYTFAVDSDDPLIFINLIIKESQGGQVEGYQIHYKPDVNWLLENNGKIDMSDYTGDAVFATLSNFGYYTLHFEKGMSYSYTIYDIQSENGRINCEGNGNGSNGGNSSGGTGGLDPANEGTGASGPMPGSGGGNSDDSCPSGCLYLYNTPPNVPESPDVIARKACEPDKIPETTVCEGDDALNGTCLPDPIGTLLPDPDLVKFKAEKWEDEICEKTSFSNNPCLSSVLEELHDSNVGFNLLSNFLGEFPVAKLCLDAKNLGSNGANGQTEKIGTNLTITFNTKQLNRSKLSIARTLLHELVHAELYRKVISMGGQISAKDFPGIYDYYRRFAKNWQHQQMAGHYVKLIADGLEEFDGSAHSRDIYEAIAWGGLWKIPNHNTNDTNDLIYSEAWKSLTLEEQALIKNRIANYQKNENEDCQ